MKQALSLLLFLSFAITFGACSFEQGSGELVTENRKTGPFTGIVASEGFEVELSQGPEESVIIEADDNVIKNVKTEIKDGHLKIHVRGFRMRDVTLKAKVTGPRLQHIQASSSARIKLQGTISSSGKMELDASSAGSIEGRVDAPEVNASASSGSRIQMQGRTRKLDAHSSSGSDLLLKDLLSEETDAKASSGSHIEVHASRQITAKSSSGSSIQFRGNPASIKKDISSGSSVESVD